MRRRVAGVLAVGIACAGIGATVAAFSKTTANSGNSFSSAAHFLALVRNVGVASCGNSSDVVTVPAAGVAAGDTLIVRAGFQDRGPLIGFTPAVSDSSGNTYQLDIDDAQAKDRAVVFSAYVATALSAGSTITLTHPSFDSTVMAVSEFRGVDAAGRVDAINSTGGNSATPSASASTTNADDLVVGSLFHDDNDSITQPGGWTALPSVTADCGVPPPFTLSSLHGAYRIVSSTATYTYDPVISGSRAWVDMVASYKG